MKLNKNGWGYQMLALLMGLIIFALLVATYLIYNYLGKIKTDRNISVDRNVVEKI